MASAFHSSVPPQRAGLFALQRRTMHCHCATNRKMRPRSKSVLIGTLALGLYLQATSAAEAGEVIYKSIQSNGEISYAWRPDPGALRTDAIKVNTLTHGQRLAPNDLQQDELMAKQDANADAVGTAAQWNKVEAEIIQAQADLQEARATLDAGRTPLPGERRGNKDGYSRLTQAYFDRQHDLELRVERARQRLDKAYDARNALK